MSRKRAVLLVGVTGTGKSTTGNCIFNQSGENSRIKDGPFVTDSGAVGCTQLFKIMESDTLKIIDTVDFCDPNINPDQWYLFSESIFD